MTNTSSSPSHFLRSLLAHFTNTARRSLPRAPIPGPSSIRPFAAACVTIQCRRHLVSLSRRVTLRKRFRRRRSNNYEITRFSLRLRRRFNFTAEDDGDRRLLCGVSGGLSLDSFASDIKYILTNLTSLQSEKQRGRNSNKVKQMRNL